MPFRDEWRSLFNILHKLVEGLQVSVKGISGLQEKLCHTKRLLLLMDETAAEAARGEAATDEEITKTLQSVIVLDEFCKEIASIIYVKSYVLRLCKEKCQQPPPPPPQETNGESRP